MYVALNELEAAIAVVAPADPDLPDAVAEPLGQPEDLYVAHVAVDSRTPKDLDGGLREVRFRFDFEGTKVVIQ